MSTAEQGRNDQPFNNPRPYSRGNLPNEIEQKRPKSGQLETLPPDDLEEKINEINEQLSETELSDTSSGTTSYDNDHASSSSNDIQQDDRQQNTSNRDHNRNHNATVIRSEVNDQQSTALELISEFLLQIMNGNYEEAQILCERVLEIEPNNQTCLEYREVLKERIQLDIEMSSEDSDESDDETESSSSYEDEDSDDDDDSDYSTEEETSTSDSESDSNNKKTKARRPTPAVHISARNGNSKYEPTFLTV